MVTGRNRDSAVSGVSDAAAAADHPEGFVRSRARLLTLLAAMTFLTVARLRAAAAAEPLPATRNPEPAGSDVFVMVREGLLRDRPSKSGRFVGKLPGGSRLRLLESGDDFLKVEVLAADRPEEDAAADKKRAAPASG